MLIKPDFSNKNSIDKLLQRAKKELMKSSKQETPPFFGKSAKAGPKKLAPGDSFKKDTKAFSCEFPHKSSHSFSGNFYWEALSLLSHTVKQDPVALLDRDFKITADQEQVFWHKIKRRKQGVPLDYLLGSKTFLNKEFFIQEGVFIPRKETETLVQRLFKQFPKQKPLKIIDAGCGVGPIALSLLSHFVKAKCWAVELQDLSIKCLKKNAQNFKVWDRLQILKKDFSQLSLQDLKNFSPSKTKSQTLAPDLITANPPYIDWKDQSLEPSVYWFEPPMALFSDQEGMAHIYLWFQRAIKLLSPKGFYLFELGWNQEKKVLSFLKQQKVLGFYEILKDSLGHARVAVTQKK